MSEPRSVSEEIETPPRNCGLLTRDLTEACFRQWSSNKDWGMQTYYGFDGPIGDAERALVHRISDLEEQVERQARIIQRLRESSHEMQRQVAGIINIVGPLQKSEGFF